MALRPVGVHLAELDDRLDRVGQLLPHDAGDLELGVKRLPLTLFVHQRLVTFQILEHLDTAVGLRPLALSSG